MFFLRTLGNLIFGNKEKMELLSLQNGTLYRETTKKNAPPKRTKVYRTCELLIRRKPGNYNYELAVQADTKKKPALVFDIGHAIQFKKTHHDKKTSFKWKDTKAENVFYIFCADQAASELTTEMFHLS
ncbi:MAG: uncharacterized protein A8A55_3015, partial [Amphiamblys sp. WSBS2006]